MGTRNLTLVKYNKQYVVAQYCQWDGYPEGQGLTVLEFLRDKMNRRKFVSGLKNLVRADDNMISALWKSMGADGSGFVSPDIADRFKKAYPSLHRDTGAKILEMIQNSDSVMVSLALDFWDDALFCEWAYKIDMDAETLSVYTGGKNLIKTWAFADLPDNKTFCEELTHILAMHKVTEIAPKIVYVVFCFDDSSDASYAIDVFDSVYLNKDEADARASDLWGGSVREVRVSGHLKPREDR